MMRSLVHRAGLGAALLALAACAGRTDAPAPAAADADVTGADRSERVALALAEADEAYAAGERERVADALRVIGAAGAGPAEGFDADPVPAWTDMAGNERIPTRGSPLGPGYRSGQIEPGKSMTIEQMFLSGERAKIVLSAPGKAALGLTVHNAKNKPVCDRNGTPNRCQWVPLFTERYSIVISNPNPRAARYYLVIE